MTSTSTLRAILAMIVSMGVFVASDTCIKLGLADAPLFQLIVMRGLFSILICLGLIVALGQAGSLGRMLNPWLLARGIFETGANFSFTIALGFVAIADLTAIVQTCPLFVLLGAWFFRGERLGWQRIGLILLGIVGALLVAQPGASAASPFAALAFITALSSATRDLITPTVPRDMPPLVATLAVLVVLTLAGAVGTLAFETQVMPESGSIWLMAFAGAAGVAGHVFLYIAYRIGPARSVAPFMYTLMIWAVLSGLLLFGDVPNTLAIAGMVLVALAGLAIIWLDGHQRKTAARVAVETLG